MTFETSIEIFASVDQVYAAFSDPKRLARWWGPDGFTNTFDVCDFATGGKWLYVMHGPDGKNYPNESIFQEILAKKKIVISHVSNPKYVLTIALTSTQKGTRVSWSQAFENEKVAKAIEHIVVPANDQNLVRLAKEVHP
ncbi:MAG: SRPBCC domain-containing protein [Bdellovibrionota bacterium]